MDFKELGINVIEYIIANIPQIMIVITTIFANFKSLNTRVDGFVKLANDSGKELKTETLSAISKIEAELTKGIEQTVEKTANTLEKMENIIENQATRIENQAKDIQYLTKNVLKLEETIFFTIELLNESLSQDAQKVSEGVTRKFNEKIKRNKVRRNEKNEETEV